MLAVKISRLLRELDGTSTSSAEQTSSLDSLSSGKVKKSM